MPGAPNNKLKVSSADGGNEAAPVWKSSLQVKSDPVCALRCVIKRVSACVCVCVAILNELLQRENRVLHFWTLKKRRLDQCQQYMVFERSAKQVSVCPCRVNASVKRSFLL